MENCDAGCKHFECCSIGHLKTCPNYPHSMQYMIDNKNDKIESLKEAFKKLLNQYESDFDDAVPHRPQWVKDALNIK